jgi:Ca-activated chloride channel family protein
VNAFRFQDPLWVLLLVPVIGFGIWSIRRQRRMAVLYSSVEILRGLPVTPAQRFKRLLPWLRVAGMVFIVLALARPQRGREEFRLRTEGIAIEMCIDRSGSMRAIDFPIEGDRLNRLDAVKRVFRDFVTGAGPFHGRPDDLIGLVVFGGFADAKCPPTLDHGALLEVLETVKIAEPVRDKKGRVINEGLWQEEQATAIGDAIAVAVSRLKDVPSKSRVIVLLSDGENTAGVVSPEDAAETAAVFGIRIYSIGIGSTGMAPFPTVDLFGRQVLQAQPVKLDEEALKALAEKTDGRYFNAQNSESLEQVYEEIEQLEKTATEGRLYTEYREVFQALMLPGLTCVLLSIGLGSTRFRSLP